MIYKEIRYRIPEDLDKRFRIICADSGLKVSKQMHELVRKFVEIAEKNAKLIENSMKR